jgi:hypothetical protein
MSKVSDSASWSYGASAGKYIPSRAMSRLVRTRDAVMTHAVNHAAAKHA